MQENKYCIYSHMKTCKNVKYESRKTFVETFSKCAFDHDYHIYKYI